MELKTLGKDRVKIVKWAWSSAFIKRNVMLKNF
jgi:hypothetical protein